MKKYLAATMSLRNSVKHNYAFFLLLLHINFQLVHMQLPNNFKKCTLLRLLNTSLWFYPGTQVVPAALSKTFQQIGYEKCQFSLCIAIAYFWSLLVINQFWFISLILWPNLSQRILSTRLILNSFLVQFYHVRKLYRHTHRYKKSF